MGVAPERRRRIVPAYRQFSDGARKIMRIDHDDRALTYFPLRDVVSTMCQNPSEYRPKLGDTWGLGNQETCRPPQL